MAKENWKKPISISMSADMLAQIDARTDQHAGGNRSTTVIEAVNNYWALLDLGLTLARKELTEHEACLVLDTLNGTWTGGFPGGTEATRWAQNALIWEVSDAISLNQYDRKWGVNGPALIAKLQGLDGIARLALADWARRMWADYEDNEKWQQECKLFLPNPGA
ncbi:MAG: hypothetical protein EOL86_11630 [Deltaproteobacteria bacterium]|nr:hypothetical protein [Deltaproteobacteria bacterium]